MALEGTMKAKAMLLVTIFLTSLVPLPEQRNLAALACTVLLADDQWR